MKNDNPKLLPPRLADWAEGHAQIGVFVRTRMGSTIEYVNDNLDEPGAREEIRGMLSPFLGDEAWPEVNPPSDGKEVFRPHARAGWWEVWSGEICIALLRPEDVVKFLETLQSASSAERQDNPQRDKIKDPQSKPGLKCQECGKPAYASYWHPDGKTLEAMLCRKHKKVFRAESAQQVAKLRKPGYPAPKAANPKPKPSRVGSDERHRQGER